MFHRRHLRGRLLLIVSQPSTSPFWRWDSSRRSPIQIKKIGSDLPPPRALLAQDQRPAGNLGIASISMEVLVKSYSMEVRGEAFAACGRGRSTREVAASFNASESWVRRVKQERRELSKVAPCLTRERTFQPISYVSRDRPSVNPRTSCDLPAGQSCRSHRMRGLDHLHLLHIRDCRPPSMAKLLEDL